MIECLILGDSIGVGIGVFRKECKTQAEVGITSSAFNKRYTPISANHTIISLGSNDSSRTYEELKKLRSNIKGGVTWVIPMRNFNDVIRVSKEFNDCTIEFKESVRSDGIHPSTDGYRKLAIRTKECNASN